MTAEQTPRNQKEEDYRDKAEFITDAPILWPPDVKS